MKAVEFIRTSLDNSANMALALLDDMKDQPLTCPTPKGGNHPLWVEGQMLQLMLGEPNPLAHWKDLFGTGSEPSADASRYPSFDEVRKAFKERRAETIRLLDTLSDADLDKPSKDCPPQFKKLVGTYGQCFFVAIANTLTHCGQVADARRAAGRKVLAM